VDSLSFQKNKHTPLQSFASD